MMMILVEYSLHDPTFTVKVFVKHRFSFVMMILVKYSLHDPTFMVKVFFKHSFSFVSSPSVGYRRNAQCPVYARVLFRRQACQRLTKLTAPLSRDFLCGKSKPCASHNSLDVWSYGRQEACGGCARVWKVGCKSYKDAKENAWKEKVSDYMLCIAFATTRLYNE